MNLLIPDNQTVLLRQRRAGGFFAVNKAASVFDIPNIDLTLTDLEGGYHELRNNFTVAIQRASNSQTYVTRWRTFNRGGMQLQARDAPYFIRDPFDPCSR